ncbi:TPA: helix-turn-helix domain-containing protein [Providencia alcalifaciens]|nr:MULTISPECIES: helix-turn-helix transcriptional regulator [Providencia]EUD03268.1 DNA-binding helix-turn-helix protein [Providencia alcalifaciens RIMD 1656011]EUD07167.1 DNA-binding helix-turn-helix protein [Providencia alcalifaciens R90-1475]MBF0690940.1 helix-turn-helix transcriptional regulator [Providencia alcalifaciens]MTC14025.1 helix-turn-helix domain-containing protein [Providencia alcalifaciens]MTC26237.1 helix-turn-helix domain-containing protein [Providencia alcalifaciens]
MSSDVLVTTLIGNKIKGLRRDAGYTAVEFAQLIGCKSAQQLYRYERGINKIDIDTLVSALKILRVDIKEFFNEVMWEIQ